MHSFHLPGGVAKGTQVYFVKFASYDIVLASILQENSYIYNVEEAI